MKAFNLYLSAALVAVASVFSSCEKEMVEPQTAPVTALSASASTAKEPKFASGDFIVQFKDSIGLVTDQDIQNLANQIAGSQLTITIFNFPDTEYGPGPRGFTGYLTKQQARLFHYDVRVMYIEADQPIIPLRTRIEQASKQAQVTLY